VAIVEISGDDGSFPIRIEVTEVQAADDSTDFYSDIKTRGIVKPAARAVAKTAQQIYAEAVEMACAAAGQTAQRLNAMDDKERPDEFEVTFALHLGTGVDTRIVSLDSDAQVQVRVQWNRRLGD
jgi:Trypsin-co-occurring domain 1